MENITKFNRLKYLILTKVYYGKHFKYLGKGSILFNPLRINNALGISIGNKVFISSGAWLIGAKNVEDMGIVIMDGTVIGNFSHIVAMKSVMIEKDVLFADKVFVTDCTHSFESIELPTAKQGISFKKKVIIGEGSWIGENVSICGASIGKHCVIGANSVVTTDIPDYSVAVGSPARIIKRFDKKKQRWIKIKENKQV